MVVETCVPSFRVFGFFIWMQQSSKDISEKYIKSENRSIHRQPLFADHNCIQTKVDSPHIVELLIYFPNIYDLFTLFSFNCELQSKESELSLEQIIGQGNFRKI